MKRITLLLIVLSLLIVSCKSEKKKDTSVKTEKTELNKPPFLVGNWIRLNNKPNTFTYENWSKDFKGLGFTLKEKDTVFKEIMSFVTINDILNLKVKGVNADATLFKITQQNDNSFTAENPTHDFPKKIKYWLENDQLKAKISNEGFEIDFVFEKIN